MLDYSRIESGDRPLKGSELVQLSDLFGVRTAVIAGLPSVRDRAQIIADTDSPSAHAMAERLLAFLELDAYLTDQGIGCA